MVICSGMANGIDTCAHNACIDSNGKTIAVLGCGIDYIYPKSNKNLYETIKKDHLLISEFPFDEAPKPEYFPIRNRIITGLCWGLFVPEVKTKSGTLVSIAHALNQNKEIFILPQPAKNNTFNNRIIRDGAILIESCEDILEE